MPVWYGVGVEMPLAGTVVEAEEVVAVDVVVRVAAVVVVEKVLVDVDVALLELVVVFVEFPQLHPTKGAIQYASPTTRSVSHVTFPSDGLACVNRLIAISYARHICVHVRFMLPSFAYHSPQSIVEPGATVDPVGGPTTSEPDVVVFGACPVYVPPGVDTHSVDPQYGSVDWRFVQFQVRIGL
jgi:hypothetical protein